MLRLTIFNIGYTILRKIKKRHFDDLCCDFIKRVKTIFKGGNLSLNNFILCRKTVSVLDLTEKTRSYSSIGRAHDF